MKKEFIICIIIVVLIVVGNIVTEKYTVKSIKFISSELESIKNELLESEQKNNKEEVTKKIEEIEKDWYKIHDNLAYFIEHNQLEKVETSIISLKSYVDVEEFEESINKIDEAIFALEHIEQKNKISLQNIF